MDIQFDHKVKVKHRLKNINIIIINNRLVIRKG